MTQSGIHKRLLKNLPFGLPKTPFHPRKGQYLTLTKRPQALRVSVRFKVEGTDRYYSCYVLNENIETTTEVLKAFHLTGDTEYEIEPNTLAIAHKIGETWWLQVGETEYVPTIDFMVDNFDRNDADTIGSLWLNPSKFGIRSQRAYESGVAGEYNRTIAFVETIAQTINDGAYPGVFSTTLVDPAEGVSRVKGGRAVAHAVAATGAMDVLYNGTFSDADHNIKIIGNISNDNTVPDFINEGLSNNFGIVTHVPPYFQSGGSQIHVHTGVQPNEISSPGDTAIVQGNYTCGHGGSSSTEATVPGQSFPASQFLHVRVRANDGAAAKDVITFGNLTSNGYFVDGDPREPCNGVWPDQHTNASFVRAYYDEYRYDNPLAVSPMSSGYNTFYFEIRSGKVSMWINGTLMFSGEDLYTVSAGMFGLRGYSSALNRFLDGDEDNHINQVKVWTADLPEPPDGESGHGTWTSEGGFVYTDKYHAGGTYNPNA
jgi:hypothetical protein